MVSAGGIGVIVKLAPDETIKLSETTVAAV
jgi:hypothetical protein